MSASIVVANKTDEGEARPGLAVNQNHSKGNPETTDRKRMQWQYSGSERVRHGYVCNLRDRQVALEAQLLGRPIVCIVVPTFRRHCCFKKQLLYS
eukprot:6188198-Pleurochrysis_carterae.AAC.4